MKLISVDHITVNLKAAEKSFEFYERIFDLKKINMVDMGDHILHLYQLPGMSLELIEYKNEQACVCASNTDVGIYRHFAVCVDDLEECRSRCEKSGYGINMLPTWIEQIHKTVMLIRDPNGVEIEVIHA